MSIYNVEQITIGDYRVHVVFLWK